VLLVEGAKILFKNMICQFCSDRDLIGSLLIFQSQAVGGTARELSHLPRAQALSQGRQQQSENLLLKKAVLRIRIRRIRMFLGLLEPEPLA
jgi:hypothetical protein